MFRQLHMTLKVRLITHLFQETIFASTIPFVAFYLTDMLSVKLTGILLTLTVVFSMLFSFIGGYVSDLHKKKFIIILLQTLMGVCLLSMGIAIVLEHIWLFVLSYLSFTLSFALQNPIMDAAIMDAIDRFESYVYKLSYWLSNVGIAAGSVLGALFYSFMPHVLFVSGFIIYVLISLAFIKWFIEIPVERRTQLNSNFIKDSLLSYVEVLKDRRYIKLTVGYSLINIGELSIFSYIAVKLKQHFETAHVFIFQIDGVKMYSIILFLNTVIVIFFTFIITKMAEKLPTHKAFVLSLIIYTLGYVGLSYFNTFGLIILAVVLATIGEIIYAPIYFTERYKLIPEAKRGSYSAIDSFGFYSAEMAARFSIVLSVYLSFFQMSLLLFVILSIGSILMIHSLFLTNVARNKKRNISN